MLQRRGYSYTDLAKWIISGLRLGPASVLLELGVGSGVLGREITKISDVRLVGIDISRQMIETAQKGRAYTLLCHGSAEDIPLGDESVDGIFTTFMFHSSLNQTRVLDEVHRVLKRTSHGVLVDLCPKPSRLPWWTLIRGNFHSFRCEYGAPSMYRAAEEIRDMLVRASLTVHRVTQLGKSKDYTHMLFDFSKGG